MPENIMEEIFTTEEDEPSFDKKISKRNNWLHFERNEILLLFSFLFFGMAFSNYEPYAPAWLNQIFQGDSLLVIGFVVIIPSMIGTIGAIFWGVMADKFGSKKFVLIGLGAFVLMFFSLIFTFSSVYFLAMIFLGYLLGSAHTSNVYALATKSISKPKEIIFAKLTITISASYAALSPLAGWIYDSFVNSMKIQLAIAAIACLIALLFAAFITKDVPIKKEKIPARVESALIDKKDVKPSKLTAVPLMFTLVMILTFFFQSGAGFWAYSSIYFLDTLLVPGRYFSIFIMVKTTLAVPLAFLLGLVKKRKNKGIIIMFFTGYFILVYGLMTILPAEWRLLIIVYGVPMYPLYNVFLYSFTAAYSNESKRATAFGLFNTIGTLGYIAGIISLGAIADAWKNGFYAGIFSMFPMSIIFASIAFIVAMIFYCFRLRKEIEHDIDDSKLKVHNEID
ncbi:MAG: MFS transporter [Candidatus Heimdallarchaeota archaeon]|nr:MFS transporter [Candidatus Heimdallarchaeota archaeon]